MSRIARNLFCLIVVCCSAPIVFAQTNTGQIKGVVRDRAGAVIPGATVTVTNVASNIKVERVTDTSGAYLFPSLQIGECTISVSATGFKQLTKTGIDLQIGQVIDLVLELEVGEVNVTETVNIAEQLMQIGTAEVSEVIDRKRVAELPLNGRQFLQLALLSEGVVRPPGGTRGAGSSIAITSGGTRCGTKPSMAG